MLAELGVLNYRYVPPESWPGTPKPVMRYTEITDSPHQNHRQIHRNYGRDHRDHRQIHRNHGRAKKACDAIYLDDPTWFHPARLWANKPLSQSLGSLSQSGRAVPSGCAFWLCRLCVED